MIWLADKVSVFLQKNRMYEVLGLFILFIVGIMLLTEGGHKAEMTLFGNHITAMNKTTFYFVILVLVLVDIVQSRYQKTSLKTTLNKSKTSLSTWKFWNKSKRLLKGYSLREDYANSLGTATDA